MADDPRDLARGLINSEPFMVIPTLVAQGGQKVQDAWDTIKSHVSSLASQAEQALTPTVQAEAAPTPAADAKQKGQKYRVKLSDGSEFDVTTDGQAPSEDDVMAFLKANPNAAKAPEKAPGSGLGTMAGAFETAKDLGKGFAKAGARSVQFLADDVPHSFGGAGLSDYVDMAAGRTPGDSYARVAAGAQPRNTAQSVGGALESAAELAIPTGAAKEAIPTVAKAGAKFQEVMGAARKLPVDVNVPGQVALRINELAERGSSMPMAVRKFLGRITDPEKGQLTYEEARDFASNISRLSSQEYQKLTPVVGREVANLRVTLNKAIADTAAKAGKGEEYAKAMTDYARAMRIRGVFDSVLEGAKRSAPYASAAAVGGYLGKKLFDLIGE